MKQIRISWQSKTNPDYKGHGEWQDISNLATLNAWIDKANNDYPDLKHWVEFQ